MRGRVDVVDVFIVMWIPFFLVTCYWLSQSIVV